MNLDIFWKIIYYWRYYIRKNGTVKNSKQKYEKEQKLLITRMYPFLIEIKR